MTHRRNLDSAIFCLVLGLAVVWNGFRLGIRVNQEMGPGFFPLLAGGLLALLSLILVIKSLRGYESQRPAEKFWVNPLAWKRVFLTLLAIGIYPLIMNRLGFFLTSLLLLFFLFRVIARLNWKVVVPGGLATAMAFRLVFDVWLRANLPIGPLGF